jgi:hypothetical protein
VSREIGCREKQNVISITIIDFFIAHLINICCFRIGKNKIAELESQIDKPATEVDEWDFLSIHNLIL